MNKRILAATFTGSMMMGSASFVSAHCGHYGIGDEKSAPAKMGNVDDKVNHLAKSLGLSDAQKSQVKPVIEEFWTKKEAMMKQHKEQMEAIHKEKADKLSAILTPEQKKKWDAMKAEDMKKGGKDKGKGKNKGKACEHCGQVDCICH